MRRRTMAFLLTFALGFLVAPLAADAPLRGDVHRIGPLRYGHPPVGADPEWTAPERAWGAFRHGLRALGWVEGQNLVIEVRFAEEQMAQVSDLAREFVTRQVEVVVVPNARTAARVQQVTRTVPIVVAGGGDLVVAGLVASLAKPGGNVTGLQVFQPDTAANMYIHRATIAALALEHRLPTVMEDRHFTEAGGLMSYGPSVPDRFRRVATYVDKLLKGANPDDLPVEQPTTFELVINLKTAAQLGLTIPHPSSSRPPR